MAIVGVVYLINYYITVDSQHIKSLWLDKKKPNNNNFLPTPMPNQSREFNQDEPLDQTFESDPYRYVQQFVRNMNNQLFLSEYHINNLYSLLLIYRKYPWDDIRLSDSQLPQKIEGSVMRKQEDINSIFRNTLKASKHAYSPQIIKINELSRVMKGKQKIIYIEKNNQLEEQQLQKTEAETKQEIMLMFAGLASPTSLLAMAMSNTISWNHNQRIFKFQINKRYIVTLENHDNPPYDFNSQLQMIPSSLYVHSIFPFFTAQQLFHLRSVCQQWNDNIKKSWYSIFTREMSHQILVEDRNQEIDMLYLCVQLRVPFFKKLNLLLQAIVELIDWESITEMVNSQTVCLTLKRVLMLLLKYIQDLSFPGFSQALTSIDQLSEDVFEHNKHKIGTIKHKIEDFFNDPKGGQLSITQLKNIKLDFLDHPLLRTEELQTQGQSPFLLLILVKQLNLYVILHNHLILSENYIIKVKRRVQKISKSICTDKRRLEKYHQIMFLGKFSELLLQKQLPSNIMPFFNEMMISIMNTENSSNPDFTIMSKDNNTAVYIDKATKVDIKGSFFNDLGGNKLGQFIEKNCEE